MSRRCAPLARAVLLGASAVLAVAGCSIQPDAAPRDIPEEDRGVFGADVATGGEAAGSNLIFLLAPVDPDEPQQLRSVLRDVPSSPRAVLGSLLAGPNTSEQNDDVTSALPADLLVNSVRIFGRVATIDVNNALDELDAVDLRLAVAQLVLTATATDGVDAVQIRVDGEDRVWPRGDGELTERPLSPFDYPGLVESTQPPYPAISSANR
jgi:Sporulation and spore germination